jgi:hypothetical protein
VELDVRFLALFSPEDEEMAKAKTGNWFIDNPQRGEVIIQHYY